MNPFIIQFFPTLFLNTIPKTRKFAAIKLVIKNSRYNAQDQSDR
jgi:hypothetical protein